jgi:hypothetical protein
MRDAYMTRYMSMWQRGQVIPFTEEALVNLYGEGAGRKLFAEQTAKRSVGFSHDNKIFVRPDKLQEVGSTTAHELTHNMQDVFGEMTSGSGMLARYGINRTLYIEYQAHLAQQRYLTSVVAEYGIDALPEATHAGSPRWLVNASPDELRAYVEKTYARSGAVEQAGFPFDHAQLEALLDELAAKQDALMEKRIQAALKQKLGGQ